MSLATFDIAARRPTTAEDGRLVEELEGFPIVDIAFNVELNSWKDKKTVQLVIVDVKPSEL